MGQESSLEDVVTAAKCEIATRPFGLHVGFRKRGHSEVTRQMRIRILHFVPCREEIPVVRYSCSSLLFFWGGEIVKSQKTFLDRECPHHRVSGQ